MQFKYTIQLIVQYMPLCDFKGREPVGFWDWGLIIRRVNYLIFF